MKGLPRVRRVKDISGQVFGRLTVIRYSHRTENRHSAWVLRCECGKEITIPDNNFKSGRTQSCGCLHKEVHTKHGMSERVKEASKEEIGTYKSWKSMVARCTNPANKHYKSYGGRGIYVTERWLNFENFLEDMGVRELNESIERLDVDGGYSIDNCIWLDRKLQSQNKRDTIWIEIKGEKLCLKEACRRYNKSYGKIMARVRRGETLLDAFNCDLDWRYKIQ